jgi:hypothetical protein
MLAFMGIGLAELVIIAIVGTLLLLPVIVVIAVLIVAANAKRKG